MSIVIAICTKDVGLLVADKRMVVNGDDSKPLFINDNTHKIFKINDNLLFGAGGRFFAKERFLAPIDGIQAETMTIDDCKSHIFRYYNDTLAKATPLSSRYYFLCGRDKSGDMKIVLVSIDLEKYQIEIEEQRPDELPMVIKIGWPSLPDSSRTALEKPFFEEFKLSRSFSDMLSAAQNLIYNTSLVTNMVSKESEYLVI